MNLVAYWHNGLGEEMSSRVRAEFHEDGRRYLVVNDWRERQRFGATHGFIVIEAAICIALRHE